MCADALGGGRWLVLPFDPISLVLAQRNGVEPPKKSAFLLRWLHHSRERCRSVVGTFLARLGAGLVRVRRYAGRWSIACPAIRPHFFCLAKRNGVEPPKKSAFLLRWLHHPRERSCLGCLYSSSPDLGRGLVGVGGLYGCAVFLGRSLFPLLPVPPHFFALAQRNGVEPQRNALMGAATGGVGSRPPLPRTRSPNITADCVKLT